MSTSVEMGSVGRRVERIDGVGKVTGQAEYTGDIVVAGMLHGALVKSSHARGRIRDINCDEALAVPGVVAVVTGHDLKATDCVSPYFGVVARDRCLLPTDEVRFVGEAVAVVVARSRDIAREAAGLVDVDVEELPAAVTLSEAMSPDAPLVHTEGYEPAGELYNAPAEMHWGSSNVVMAYETSKGDVTAAFAAAARVVEGRYSFPGIYHYAMEPFCALADADADNVVVWSSAQHPNQVQADIARMWGRPLSSVRVIATFLGGGFGSKSFSHVEPMAVAASLTVGAPVRIELDIAESMAVSRRHGMEGTVRTAIDAQGGITGVIAELDYDGGAYTLLGPYVVTKGAFRALGGYNFDAYQVTSRLVYTNTSPAGSFRAIGGPQASWAMESHLDEVARVLDRTPFDVRAGLVARRGEEFRPGRTPMDGDIGDTLTALTAMREEARRAVPAELGPEWRRGSGLALGVSDPGASPVSSAIVRLLSDGSVSVSVGSSELGQGVRTVIAQIVAETLHVDFSVVRVVPTDTGSGPYDASTGASRSTTMSGLAAHRAAQSIVDRVLHCTAEREQVPVEELLVRDGAVVLPDGRTVPMGLVVQQVFGQRGGNLIGVGEVVQQEFPTTPAFWEISAGTAEVAVDTGTGEVRILGYGTSSDVGRAVNPITMEGQEEGAFAQGLGHALFEEMRWDAGQPVTDSLVNYRVPRAADMPRWFKSVQIQNADGPGAFGIKGGGEGPIMPAAGAIGNALRDACGVRITELPLHAERVWRALVNAGVAQNHSSATERTT